MRWIKASERLPDCHKNIVCKFGKNRFMAALVDGYFVNGNTNFAPIYIEWLEETPSEQGQDGWISVEDRLPTSEKKENHIYCLVNDTYWGIVVRPFNVYHHCWDGEDADDYYTDAIGGKITHWRKLPNPPPKNSNPIIELKK